MKSLVQDEETVAVEPENRQTIGSPVRKGEEPALLWFQSEPLACSEREPVERAAHILQRRAEIEGLYESGDLDAHVSLNNVGPGTYVVVGREAVCIGEDGIGSR